MNPAPSVPASVCRYVPRYSERRVCPRLWCRVLGRRVRGPNRIAFLATRGGAVAPWRSWHGPSLSCRGNGYFPLLLCGHLETSLANGPSPAILIHKDEGAGGNVTGPGAMAA